MIESALVIVVVLGVAAVGWLGPLIPLTTWLSVAIGFTAAGLLLGVPTGFWYHVRLHRCLAPRRQLPRRWWLRPVALHPHLRPEERRGVLLWFTAGGAGFVLTAIGLALALIGLGLELLHDA